MSVGWTQEEYDCLRELAARGFTAAQVMAGINERFGLDRTRNAIIGASHRIHVQIGRPNRGALKSAAKRKARLSRKRRPRLKILQPSPPAKEMLVSEPLMPKPKREPPWSVADLTSRTCRWIDGDPSDPRPFACPEPKVVEKPYCSIHLKRAFGPSHRGRIMTV
jgi:hypothetical protein